MSIFVGTSGFNHKEWKGSFYPEQISLKKMLAYYAEQFTTVEINFTFYQLPNKQVVTLWAEQVPEAFRFVLKAPQLITHFRRLQNAEREIDEFLDVVSPLAERQGPILFQFPPAFTINVPSLAAFLKHIAGRAKVAVEFRHPSWHDTEVIDCLRSHSAALCCTDGQSANDLIRTAGWCYVRFQGDNYSDECLSDWINRIRNWDDSYCIFMHSESGIAPNLARRFAELAGLL